MESLYGASYWSILLERYNGDNRFNGDNSLNGDSFVGETTNVMEPIF